MRPLRGYSYIGPRGVKPPGLEAWKVQAQPPQHTVAAVSAGCSQVVFVFQLPKNCCFCFAVMAQHLLRENLAPGRSQVFRLPLTSSMPRDYLHWTFRISWGCPL